MLTLPTVLYSFRRYGNPSSSSPDRPAVCNLMQFRRYGKAQTEAYNGMENAYLLANRYIDVMPEVAEAVAKPLTAVDSIKMYGDGNATKLVRDTTGMVDQVTSGLKDATGIDLTELLSSFHQPFQPREDNE